VVKATISTTVVTAAVAWAAASSLQAADGVLIVSRITTAAGQMTSQLQVDKTRVRTETTDSTGRSHVVVFDSGKQALYIINPEAKTYSELTKADADRMGGQINDAMSQMQAQLANMPPEQRAMVEKMMAARMGGAGRGAAAAKTEYRKTGTDTVGKWPCDKYEGTQNGQKTSEVCTVDPTSIGLALSDLQVLQQFAEFFKKMIPMASSAAQGFGETGLSGFPVKTVARGADGSTTTSEVTAATRQSFDDSLFGVPPGFQKIDMMGGRGRR
jgi:Domain of unknown function (DUF4412)